MIEKFTARQDRGIFKEFFEKAKTKAERIDVKGFFKKRCLKQNSLMVAQIHATILGIAIAAFAIALVYMFDILREKELSVFNDALRINDLDFPVSYVSHTSEFPSPKNADDSVKLADELTDLADCIGYKNPEEMVILEDIVSRARKIFVIINHVTHRHPFPRFPVQKSNLFSKTEFLQFDTVEDIRKWREDLQKVSQALYLPALMILSRPQIADALLKNDESYIAALRAFRDRNDSFGHTDLHFVVRDFYSKLNRALEISNDVAHSLIAYDRQRQLLHYKTRISIGLVLGGCAFLFGVIVPIVSAEPKEIYCIWIPISVYVFALIYAVMALV